MKRFALIALCLTALLAPPAERPVIEVPDAHGQKKADQYPCYFFTGRHKEKRHEDHHRHKNNAGTHGFADTFFGTNGMGTPLVGG